MGMPSCTSGQIPGNDSKLVRKIESSYARKVAFDERNQ